MEDPWSTICLRSKVGLGYHYNQQSAASHACACTTICNVYTAYLPHHMIEPCDTCCWGKLYYIAVLLEVTYPKFNYLNMLVIQIHLASHTYYFQLLLSMGS